MSYAIFPVLKGVNWGLAKRPNWNTATHKTAAGNEYRTGFRQYPITEFDLSYSYMSLNDKLTMEGFFNQQNGALTPFYFDAQNDDTVSGFGVGTGDGTTTTFTIYKPAGTGAVEPVQGFNVFNLYKNDWQGNQLQYPTPRTNYAPYSSNMSSSGWGLNGTGTTITTGVTAPDGSTNAITVNNLAGGYQGVFATQPALANGGELCWGLWMKGSGTIEIDWNDVVSNQNLEITLTPTWTFVQANPAVANSKNPQIRVLSYPTNTATSVSLAFPMLMIGSQVVGDFIPTTSSSPVTVTDYSLSGNQVTFSIAPESGAVITWSGSYYYLVRFDGDTLDFNQFYNLMYELQECKLVVVR